MRRALGIFPWLAVACAATPHFPADPIGALREAASSELSCPQTLLQIEPLGSERFKDTPHPLYQSVQGCSLHVIYTATDAGYVMTKGSRARPSKAPDHVDVR